MMRRERGDFACAIKIGYNLEIAERKEWKGRSGSDIFDRKYRIEHLDGVKCIYSLLRGGQAGAIC